MVHKITPDEEDENIEIGRFIHEYRYGRQKKEIAIDNVKIDSIKKENGNYIVQEIKKSSRYLESARFQLLYYLDTLRQMGIHAKGELLFPEERKRESVKWTIESKIELENAIADIQKIVVLPVPPIPRKISFCKKCAYREYCWAEG